MSETPVSPARSSPSTSLLGHLRAELSQHMPFSAMKPEHVDEFLAAASQLYFAPNEVVLDPSSGPVQALLYVRRGSVSGRRGVADTTGPIEYVAGDLFPVGALLASRAVTATYTTNEDSFCLRLPAAAVQALVLKSAPFADFLNGRVLSFLELSRRATQAAFASQTLAEQSLETRLADLPPKTPLSCAPGTPLAEALSTMHERRVGSMLVLGEQGQVLGILTRHDILGRVTLPQRPLSTPISDVMSQPVQTLDVQHRLSDAAMLMSRHGLRHVPVLREGRVVNILSERDLFAMQRLSLKQLGASLRSAPDEATLVMLAGRIREFARNLLGQGVHARQLTELVSHLNDLLAERLVELVAARQGLDLSRACWLAFGSEGRSEQTVATDQDNGLVFDSDDAERDRPVWLAFGREVNEALDRAGYPLCKGGVMAGNPACCHTPAEWADRIGRWIEHGAPQDLLDASIYFDLRPVAGHLALAAPLQRLIAQAPARVPRFLKQMADNSLRRGVPLNWRGGLDPTEEGAHAWIDLKLQGTAIFVDAARLYALAHGLDVQGTRARLEAAAPLMGAAEREADSWVASFEFLQMLRLQLQLGHRGPLPGPDDNPNRIDVKQLNDIDRRLLKESLRAARHLQQRLQLDYQR
ncbi:MAG: CBS domain-containing protein [Rubrivivax sp.]|nr:CBS domain-containing protein [Rubrivivax sp.]